MVVVAAVTTRGPIDEAEVFAYVGGRLPGYKRPRQIIVRDSLPTSTVGKPMRRSVRDELVQAQAHGQI